MSNTEILPGWGGYRRNAGRREEKRKLVSLTVQIPESLRDSIKREAERDGVSMSKVAGKRLARRARK